MFNLLPREERAALRAEYRTRQYIVFAGLVAVLGVISVCLLLPSYFSYLTTDLLLRSEQRSIQAAEPSEEKDTREIVARGNAIAKQIGFFTPTLHSPTLSKLLARVVSGIRISSLTLATQDDTRIQISLEGIASTRTSLQAFEESLNRDNSFVGVDIPLSSYTRDTNIPFSITFFATP